MSYSMMPYIKHKQTNHNHSERSSQHQHSSKDLNTNTNHTHTERSSQQQLNIKAPINTNITYTQRWTYRPRVSSRGSAGYSGPVDRGPGSPHSLAQKERKQEAKGHHNHWSELYQGHPTSQRRPS
ncbi:unnamed protein product [Arctogadus glacialis]